MSMKGYCAAAVVFVALGSSNCSRDTSVLLCKEVSSEEMAASLGLKPDQIPEEMKWNSKICNTSGYSFLVQTEAKSKASKGFGVLRDGRLVVSLDGQTATFWTKAASTVSAMDKNDDGAIDFLSYDTKVDGVRTTTSLFDRNLDGELDVRAVLARGKTPEVWWLIDGSWYQKVDSTDGLGVLVDGVPKQVEDVNKVYVFSKH